MSKAFIFDMDGVLVNTEQVWFEHEGNFLDKLFGREISQKIGDTVGVSLLDIYRKAKGFGFNKSLEEVQGIWDETAFRVYDKAIITQDTDKLMEFLISNNFIIGLVSASKMSWINKVLPRLPFKNSIASIISLEHELDLSLRPKPSPDKYMEMMKRLKTDPGDSIILEDSNTGIIAATSSGAFTIGFTQNLLNGYKQIDITDAKANNMKEVIEIVRNWLEFN
jgi:beta-phosphoglucomutase-like phosphatase (HAD superfamily)